MLKLELLVEASDTSKFYKCDDTRGLRYSYTCSLCVSVLRTVTQCVCVSVLRTVIVMVCNCPTVKIILIAQREKLGTWLYFVV